VGTLTCRNWKSLEAMRAYMEMTPLGSLPGMVVPKDGVASLAYGPAIHD